MPTYRAVVRTTAPGMPGPGYSTFHYRTDVVPLQADLDNAALALRALYTQVATVQGSAVVHYFDGRFVEVDGDSLRTAPTWQAVGSSNAVASDALPPATTICVTWRTESNSRSGRGRTFLSGWREGNNDSNGTPGSTELAAIASGIAGLVDFNEDGPGAFAVYSESQSLARDIVSGATRDVWAVLRSRRD